VAAPDGRKQVASDGQAIAAFRRPAPKKRAPIQGLATSGDMEDEWVSRGNPGVCIKPPARGIVQRGVLAQRRQTGAGSPVDFPERIQ